jgi:hypothetical protein
MVDGGLETSEIDERRAVEMGINERNKETGLVPETILDNTM